MGVGIYKCWDDMKHLVIARNEKLLHEGFRTLEEVQRYIQHHSDHHVGAKKKERRRAAHAAWMEQERRSAEAEKA